jgi:hypothetical protein
MARKVSSELSELTQVFWRRVGACAASPEYAVLELVRELRKSAKAKLGQVPFDKYLELRNVMDVSYRHDFGFEGKIEPIGTTYMDGFRIVLNRSSSGSRSRYTLAHELCHTFFYELVPEIKFLARPIDPVEERLCNIGAAELLMPEKLVMREAKGQPICLGTLEGLAALFRVSNEAMVLRLIQLKLWQVEFSSWIRLSNGKFAMERVMNGTIKDWEWPNTNQLEEAWTLGKPTAGHQFLTRYDNQGVLQVIPIRFDLARRQNRICVLWGKGVTSSNANHGSLFQRRVLHPLLPEKGRTQAARALNLEP